MLSYRHEYHAGNHADVLKHLVQIAILDYMIQKDKPITYIDTHAGQAIYTLNSALASKNKEYEQGFHKIRILKHPLIERYQRYFDNDFYLGSVAIAQDILRDEDRLRCFEMHPTDFTRLSDNTAGDKRVKCFSSDGFQGLISQVPPQSKRGFILIDPSYETTNDYHQVIECLKKAMVKFANGVYMVWYPLLIKQEVDHLHRKLTTLKIQGKPVDSLSLQLTVRRRSEGMFGSGVFIINPPWQLESQFKDLLPLLESAMQEN